MNYRKHKKLEQKYANMDLVRIAEIFGTPEQARAAAEGMVVFRFSFKQNIFRRYSLWRATLLRTFIIRKYDERTSKDFIRR